MVFFFDNHVVYEIMWKKNMVQRGRSQMTIWRMRYECWITEATDTHWKSAAKTYCFSTSTMVTRTRLSVTSRYVPIHVSVSDVVSSFSFSGTFLDSPMLLHNSCVPHLMMAQHVQRFYAFLSPSQLQHLLGSVFHIVRYKPTQLISRFACPNLKES